MSRLLCTGTYQGQWLRGQRHGYGIRQSAAFDDASPFRGIGSVAPTVSSSSTLTRKQQQQQHRKKHHKSLPSLAADGDARGGGGRTSTAVSDRSTRTRSGFALTGPGTETGFDGRVSPGSSFRPRSRSTSLRRTTSDSFGLNGERKKSKMQSSTGDVPSRVSILTAPPLTPTRLYSMRQS